MNHLSARMDASTTYGPASTFTQGARIVYVGLCGDPSHENALGGHSPFKSGLHHRRCARRRRRTRRDDGAAGDADPCRSPATRLSGAGVFVTDVPADRGATAIVRAVTMLAHDLGLDVVAEGGETAT
jgi:hypothetical protein